MKSQKKISVVTSIYNEIVNIDELYLRIKKVFEETGYDFELICVDNASTDGTFSHLVKLNEIDNRVKIVSLSRNFGQEMGFIAGMQYSSGDAVVVMDADLQDPPETIARFIEKWEEGYDVIYAIRSERECDPILKKITASLFYKFIRKLSPIDIPKDVGVYRLMSKPVVDSLNATREQYPFIRSSSIYYGFNKTGIYYKRDARYAGESKYSLKKSWRLALDGITYLDNSLLTIPLYIGVFATGISILMAIFAALSYFIFKTHISEFQIILLIILFLSGIQFMFMGIIGEYLGRIHIETKKRPLYITRECIGFDNNGSSIQNTVLLHKEF